MASTLTLDGSSTLEQDSPGPVVSENLESQISRIRRRGQENTNIHHISSCRQSIKGRLDHFLLFGGSVGCFCLLQ